MLRATGRRHRIAALASSSGSTQHLHVSRTFPAVPVITVDRVTAHSSRYWIDHFSANSRIDRVDWELPPTITAAERRNILRSLQAWQLGETSDGAHLLRAATRYAEAVGDREYPDAVRLFIAEEQKHGRHLGRYLDLIGEPRLSRDWGDTLFRRVRYHNTSMELWTLAVITVESAAQIFYRALKDATECVLLRGICTDILVDEAAHIVFQKERMSTVFRRKSPVARWLARPAYSVFFTGVGLTVWVAHRRLFRAGGVPLASYRRRMAVKRRALVGGAALLGAEPRGPVRSPRPAGSATMTRRPDRPGPRVGVRRSGVDDDGGGLDGDGGAAGNPGHQG